MNMKTFVTILVAGLALTVGGTSYAADENVADWKTTLNVKLALLDKLGGDSLRVEVSASEGVVTLTGMVHKRETRELAETVTKSVVGVKTIHNSIELEAEKVDPNKTGVAAGEAEAEVKDAVLETKVRIALVDQMGTDGFKIGTEAASGVVTLEFGENLPTARRKQAVGAVEKLEGVTKVVTVDKK